MHESEKWKWSRSVMSDSSQPHGLQPPRLLHPWDFPSKSTGVGCHCLPREECSGCWINCSSSQVWQPTLYLWLIPEACGNVVTRAIVSFSFVMVSEKWIVNKKRLWKWSRNPDRMYCLLSLHICFLCCKLMLYMNHFQMTKKGKKKHKTLVH